MNYIENIFICLTAPLLLLIPLLKGGRRRQLLFLLAGMTACLLSSYISTFLASVHGAERSIAAIEIAPFIEETMKLLPILFYLLVFEPSRRKAAQGMLMIAAGFATFENVCFLTANGASQLSQLVIRGFGTGAMHIVCGMLSGVGLFFLWDRLYLRFAGTYGLLCLSTVYHAIFNLLVSQDGLPFIIGALIPVVSIAVIMFFLRRSHIWPGKEPDDLS